MCEGNFTGSKTYYMKKITLFLYLTLSSVSISAQVVWNKKLPISSIGASLGISSSRIDGNNFLVSSGKQFLELNHQGTIIGLQDGAQFLNNPLISYIQKRKDPGSGRPFFLMGWRNFVNSPYNLAFYKPDNSGWQGLLTFGIGEVGNPGSRGPVVLELNDTTLLVFTKSFVRKISSPRDTLWIDWTKPLNLEALSFPNAAVTYNDQVIFVTTKGEISATNADGFQIWLKKHSDHVFRGIAQVGNEFIACGISPSGHAALVNFNSDGSLVWEKTFPDDLEFNALVVSAEGSIFVTGKSVQGNIPLLKISQNGDLIWRKTFQKGIGTTIIGTPDAGYFLTAGSNQSGFYGIKTNALGETSALDDLELFRNRNLNTGGFSLTQSPSPSLFRNHIGSGFHILGDSITTTYSTHNPWLAGFDSGNNLHLSASTSGESFNKSDYKTGISNAAPEDFNRLWAVTREEINLIRRDFGEDGDLDTPPSFDLLTWPAKGNLFFNQNLDYSLVSTIPDSFPAPFIDANGDGIYNIFDGDYPRIKGDKMLWWAITDNTEHSESKGLPLGVDLFLSVFAYDCPENKTIQQTLFVEYQIINRSGQSYSDTYLGFYTNLDLGCPEYDYNGSLPVFNSVFVYNQDTIDALPSFTCTGDIATFGDHLPVGSITMLNHTLDHSMYFNRGGGNVPASTINPSVPQEYFHYLNSLWRDGTPLTIGGTGYNPNDPNATPTNFIFPDNPADSQGWSMCTENLGLSDRRMLNSHGPFTFAAGDTFTMRLAFIIHPDIPHPCPDIKGLVEPTIQQIQQWHDDGTLEAHLDLGSVLTLATGQSLVLNATQQNPATTYAWSTGQNTPSITVNQTGEYTVTVTPSSGCAYTETVLVKSASGTSSPTLPTWLLQPNPASDVLRIVFESNEKPITALLRNAQGQTMATKNGTGNSLEMSVSNLPSGLYWAELWHEGQFLGSRKVVVAH